jgi:hypothetical protein
MLLGGGGLLGAIYNWYTFHRQSSRQDWADFWDSYERQAASAEKRGEQSEASRIRLEYEEQLEAWRAQQEIKRLAPPDRIESE